MPRQGGGDALAKRRAIFLRALEGRIDGAADPARERHARCADGALGEQRVIDAAEPQSHDEDHRRIDQCRDVRHRMGLADGREPAAGAFDHHGLRGERESLVRALEYR